MYRLLEQETINEEQKHSCVWLTLYDRIYQTQLRLIEFCDEIFFDLFRFGHYLLNEVLFRIPQESDDESNQVSVDYMIQA